MKLNKFIPKQKVNPFYFVAFLSASLLPLLLCESSFFFSRPFAWLVGVFLLRCVAARCQTCLSLFQVQHMGARGEHLGWAPAGSFWGEVSPKIYSGKRAGLISKRRKQFSFTNKMHYMKMHAQCQSVEEGGWLPILKKVLFNISIYLFQFSCS